MDNSETQAKAIRLGKELVKVLELEPGGNTLSRWMAHYLAEQLALAETAEGAEKAAANDRCFKTVLALWQQRSDWPSGLRPFEDFEPIFETLARLNPDEPRPFFHRLSRTKDASVGKENSEVINLIEFVEGIDVATRFLIEIALESAAEKATSETTKSLLREALSGTPEFDVRTVRRLMKQDGEEPEDKMEARAELIARRLEQLDRFGELCKKVRSAYAGELRALRARSKKEDS